MSAVGAGSCQLERWTTVLGETLPGLHGDHAAAAEARPSCRNAVKLSIFQLQHVVAMRLSIGISKFT